MASDNSMFLHSSILATKRLERARLRGTPKPGDPPNGFKLGLNEALYFNLRDITGLDVSVGSEPRMQEFWTDAPLAFAPADLPPMFDWRNQNSVTPARAQGECGSCWAFGAIGAFEGSWLKSLGEGDRKPDELNMSEQHVLNCTQGSTCGGGWHMDALLLLKERGTDEESKQPYVAQEQQCRAGDMPYKASGEAKFVKDSKSVPSEEEIKTALIQHGPLSVCIEATSAMHAYTGGVLKEGSGGDINHVVTLIGWNNEKQAWIIKNSWGDTWGEEAGGPADKKGFAYVAYGSNSTGYAAAWIDAKAQGPQDLNSLRAELARIARR